MLSDVIAALATPPGRSAIALLRVSGRGAHRIAAAVLDPFTVNPPRTARRSRAIDPANGELLDDVLYVAYRGPGSYTGEDLIEITTHGGLLVAAEVLAAFMAAGARQALPGEFTRRAVLNGKMDLLQAEAVADLIEATAPAQRRAAVRQLDRGLSDRIGALRQQVLDLEALVCYEIDFPEEDSGPVAPADVAAAIERLRQAIKALRATAGEGERLREGALAVIAGCPNAGKSALFNALLGTDRALVTEVPGTTRDAIEAPAICGGFPFRLVDTAGIRDSDDRIERMGIEVSRRYLASADVVLVCVEAGRPPNEAEAAFRRELVAPAILVRTKSDLQADSDWWRTVDAESAGWPGQVVVSALSGEGLAELRSELSRVAFSGLLSQGDVEPFLTRARHSQALEAALAEVDAFAAARSAGVETLVAATHLRAAVTSLEDVIGWVNREDVLERVFSTFCIGK